MPRTKLASLSVRLRGLLGRVEVRLLLSACIIVSLLPYPWVARLDGVFLLVFGLELGCRGLLLFRGAERGEWRLPAVGDVLLLLLDLAALISFLPLSDGEAASNRFFRLFRLSRMLLLLGYWAPLARDVWTVMARRERARQIMLMGAVVLALSFSGAVIIEHIADQSAEGVDFDGDGQYSSNDRSFLVLLWWAFRQVQDPGNMISSPFEVTAMVVSVGLTVFGLFLVSFLIGLGTDVVRELMELSSLREPGLRGHTVIVHMNQASQQLLSELTRYYQKWVPEGGLSRRWFGELLHNTRRARARRYVVVGRGNEPPEFLRRGELASVVYRPWTSDDAALLRRTDMQQAQRVMLLADHSAPDPDAETLQILLTIAEAQPRSPRPRRPQLLIAEVVDEGAIPAARAAIAGNQARAFIVPTERLIALFVACAIRQRGGVRLLEALLASDGYDLYTCFFDVPGLAFTCERSLIEPQAPAAAMAALLQRADGRPIIPVGLLLPGDGFSHAAADVRVCINPGGRATEAAAVTPYRGFVALAPHFEAVRDFAESLREAAPAPRPASAEVAAPTLMRAPTAAPRRSLLCGFRSATVSLCEAIVMASPTAEILVMVGDVAARAAALDHFDAHSNLVKSGRLPARHGVFEAVGEGILEVRRGEERLGTIHVAIGDFTSSRQLMALPRGFGGVDAIDVVILLASEREHSDPAISKSLMKLEALLGERERRPQVLAELADPELARRLRQHYERRGRADVQVISLHSLRSLFLFQAVVVPNFDAVYAELLGPWGQSLLRMEPGRGPAGRCTFEGVAARQRAEGAILVAIEVRGADGTIELCLGRGPEGDGWFESHALVAAWVIARDDAALS
jgi:hypothetical protein